MYRDQGRWVLLVFAAGATLAASVAGWISQGDRVEMPISVLLPTGIAFMAVGLFLSRHRVRSRVSQLTWLIGETATLGLAAIGWSENTIAAWVAQWLWWVPLWLLPLLLLDFPRAGRTSSRIILLIRLAGISSTMLLAVAALGAPRTLVADPSTSISEPFRTLFLAACLIAFIPIGAIAGSVVVIVSRARRAVGDERRQFLCLAPAAILLTAGVVADGVGVSWGLTPGILALPLGIGVAIIEYKLDDLDTVIRRGAVLLLITTAIVAGYASVLVAADRFALSLTSAGDVHPPLSVIVIAIVAASLDPIRRWLQLQIARFLYGSRDDPYLVLSDLGREVERAKDPLTVLQGLCTTVARSLRLPYVGIRLNHADAHQVVAEHGRPIVDVMRFPMTLKDRSVGELIASPRRHGASFNAQEIRLLTTVGRQATVAAEAFELEQARQNALVRKIHETQQAERSRIRRDLHDGLGPVLAGVRLTLQSLIPGCPNGELVASLRTAIADLGEARNSIRTLIDDLGPECASIALSTSLHRTAKQVLSNLETEILIPFDADSLPPRIATALLNIGKEAMTNTARHSGAEKCWVSLVFDPDIRMEVRDDGHGGDPSRWNLGIGMNSMRERANGCGGELVVTSGPEGTVVTVAIPLNASPESWMGELAGGEDHSKPAVVPVPEIV